MIIVGVKKMWLQMEKIKNVPNYPKWQENWTKMFFWNFYLSSPSVGIQNIWLKMEKMKK